MVDKHVFKSQPLQIASVSGNHKDATLYDR